MVQCSSDAVRLVVRLGHRSNGFNVIPTVCNADNSNYRRWNDDAKMKLAMCGNTPFILHRDYQEIGIRGRDFGAALIRRTV